MYVKYKLFFQRDRIHFFIRSIQQNFVTLLYECEQDVFRFCWKQGEIRKQEKKNFF